MATPILPAQARAAEIHYLSNYAEIATSALTRPAFLTGATILDDDGYPLPELSWG